MRITINQQTPVILKLLTITILWLLISSAEANCHQEDSTNYQAFWLRVGAGINSRSWGSSIGTIFSYENDDLILTFRYTLSQEFLFSIASVERESFSETALMFTVRGDHILGIPSAFSVGPSHLRGFVRESYLEQYEDPPFEQIRERHRIVRRSTPGLAFDLEMFGSRNAPLSLSSYAFGVVSKDYSFFGVLVCIRFRHLL